MLDTMNSAVTPTMTAVTTIMTMVVGMFICGVSSSSLLADDADDAGASAVSSLSRGPGAYLRSVPSSASVSTAPPEPGVASTSGLRLRGKRTRRPTRRARFFTRPGTAAISGP